MSEEDNTAENLELDVDLLDEDDIEALKAQLKARQDELSKTRREAAKYRVRAKDKDAELEEFRAWKDSQKSELERAHEAKTASDRTMKELERENNQIKAALKADLDVDLAGRIQGDSLDEMIEDAKSLAEKFGSKDSVRDYAGRRGTATQTQDKKGGGAFLESLAKYS